MSTERLPALTSPARRQIPNGLTLGTPWKQPSQPLKLHQWWPGWKQKTAPLHRFSAPSLAGAMLSIYSLRADQLLSRCFPTILAICILLFIFTASIILLGYQLFFASRNTEHSTPFPRPSCRSDRRSTATRFLVLASFNKPAQWTNGKTLLRRFDEALFA